MAFPPGGGASPKVPTRSVSLCISLVWTPPIPHPPPAQSPPPAPPQPVPAAGAPGTGPLGAVAVVGRVPKAPPPVFPGSATVAVAPAAPAVGVAPWAPSAAVAPVAPLASVAPAAAASSDAYWWSADDAPQSGYDHWRGSWDWNSWEDPRAI